MNKCRIFILGFLCWFSALTYADETLAKNLKIVTTDYAPYNTDNHGNRSGFSTLLVEALLQEIDLDVEIEFLPWARAYQTALNRPNTLIYSIARTEKRESKFFWVGRLLPMDTFLYKACDRQDLQIKTLNDIGKLLIGGIHEGAPSQWLQEQKFNVINMATNSQLNLNMLLKGRLDLLVMDPASLEIVMRQAQIPIEQIKPVLYLPEPSYDLYLALSQHSSKVLQVKLFLGYKRLKVSGTYDKIVAPFYKKYSSLTLAQTNSH